MISFSYPIAAITALTIILITWLLSRYITSRSFNDWKVKFDKLNKEHLSMTKKIKKEVRATEQYKEKAESWKREYQHLNQKQQESAKEHKEQLESLKEKQILSSRQIESLKRELASINLKGERIKDDNDKLKAKYKKEVLGFKDWANERKKLETELKDITRKYEKQIVISKDFKIKYEKQTEQINGVRVLQREGRVLKTKINKFEADIKYWEQKHYDTHHELAQLKTSYEALKVDFRDLKQLRKGDEVLRSNLTQQIQEFKSKFVNINNKYSEMVNSIHN